MDWNLALLPKFSKRRFGTPNFDISIICTFEIIIFVTPIEIY